MAGDILFDFTKLISALPVDVIKNISDFIMILKAVGIMAIVYFVYVIIMGFFTYRRIKKVDSIEKKIDVVDGKLDKLLKKYKKD
jgi:hypothetical protein